MSVARIIQTAVISTAMVLGSGSAALANNGSNGHGLGLGLGLNLDLDLSWLHHDLLHSLLSWLF